MTPIYSNGPVTFCTGRGDITVLVEIAEQDGHLLVTLDTDGVPEGFADTHKPPGVNPGPQLRVRLNDALIHNATGYPHESVESVAPCSNCDRFLEARFVCPACDNDD